MSLLFSLLCLAVSLHLVAKQGHYQQGSLWNSLFQRENRLHGVKIKNYCRNVCGTFFVCDVIYLCLEIGLRFFDILSLLDVYL